LTKPARELKENGARDPMTLDFTCQACDATFDVELTELLDEPVVQCPSCEARAPRAAVEGVTGALDDLFAQLAVLRRKFTVVLEVASDELPPVYERQTQRPAVADVEEDDEDEEGDEEGWDEEAAEREEDEER
jgi:hypothetical protein